MNPTLAKNDPANMSLVQLVVIGYRLLGKAVTVIKVENLHDLLLRNLSLWITFPRTCKFSTAAPYHVVFVGLMVANIKMLGVYAKGIVALVKQELSFGDFIPRKYPGHVMGHFRLTKKREPAVTLAPFWVSAGCSPFPQPAIIGAAAIDHTPKTLMNILRSCFSYHDQIIPQEGLNYQWSYSQLGD